MNIHIFGTQENFDKLLEWRDTPRDEILKSPVQRLMKRPMPAQVPAQLGFLQKNSPDQRAVTENLLDQKRKQAKYYNRRTVPLPHVKSEQPL